LYFYAFVSLELCFINR